LKSNIPLSDGHHFAVSFYKKNFNVLDSCPRIVACKRKLLLVKHFHINNNFKKIDVIKKNLTIRFTWENGSTCWIYSAHICSDITCWIYSAHIASKAYGGLKSLQTATSLQLAISISLTKILAFSTFHTKNQTIYMIDMNYWLINERWNFNM